MRGVQARFAHGISRAVCISVALRMAMGGMRWNGRRRGTYGSPTPATTKLQDTITQWLFEILVNQTYR
jgi:hypothetical protein